MKIRLTVLNIAVFFALLCLPATSRVSAADWPTFRGDERRSGVARETLRPPLSEAWVRLPTHAPQPAWPAPAQDNISAGFYGLSSAMTYDRAFHTVASGNLVYYASSADDTLRCLDADTGQLRWKFVTEGPLRLAPVLSDSKVYLGSDDGFLYCLDAKDGRFLWKYRAIPEDLRLPGNERMISRCPVRCGIVVQGGQVFFTAGLFPSRGGVYLCALQAETGAVIWKKKINVSGQGYLLASPTRLFVPTGRTPFRAFDLSNGEELGKFGRSSSWGKDLVGGCFAILIEDTLATGPSEDGQIHLFDSQSKERLLSANGLQMIADGPLVYLLGKEGLSAMNRTEYVRLSQEVGRIQKNLSGLSKEAKTHTKQLQSLAAKKEKSERDEKTLAVLKQRMAAKSAEAKALKTRMAALEIERKACWKWKVPAESPLTFILSGETLYIGGEGQVSARDVRDGRGLWKKELSGKVYGLALSDGRLFASTDQGAIHCFESAKKTKPFHEVVEKTSEKSLFPTDLLTPLYERAAEKAIQAAGVEKGFCLVLDAGTGRLARQIALRSDFRIICVQPDEKKAKAAREALAAEQLYGNRVVIHQVDPTKLPYPKHFANLIVSDEMVASGKAPASLQEILRVLRPSGGALVVAQSAAWGVQGALEKWGESLGEGWKVQTDSWTLGREGRSKRSVIGVFKRDALPGAGEWTHAYGDSGNTACSGDTLVQGPMDLQWFGRPGPRRMAGRHTKNMPPLYKDGRLFIAGYDYFAAVDAYNGVVLWEKDLPGSVRLGVLKDSSAMAVAGDALYVASNGECSAFDVKTGERKRLFAIPKDLNGPGKQWGYVAVVDSVLFGSVKKPGANLDRDGSGINDLIWDDYGPLVCSDSLFALDCHTGALFWTYTPDAGVILNPTLAVAGGRVYFVESKNPETTQVGNGLVKLDALLSIKGANLAALDIRTGTTLWKRPAQLQEFQHVVYLSCARDTVVLTGTRNVVIEGQMRVRYDQHIFDAPTGKPLWSRAQTPTPDHIIGGGHGEQVQHPAIVGDVVYGTGFASDLRTGDKYGGWKWSKSKKCGTISTSANSLFCRYASALNPYMFDLETGRETALTAVTRPGCWINIIPAGGLVLIPEASSGCTCGDPYSIQTSLALSPRDMGL